MKNIWFEVDGDVDFLDEGKKEIVFYIVFMILWYGLIINKKGNNWGWIEKEVKFCLVINCLLFCCLMFGMNVVLYLFWNLVRRFEVRLKVGCWGFFR